MCGNKSCENSSQAGGSSSSVWPSAVADQQFTNGGSEGIPHDRGGVDGGSNTACWYDIIKSLNHPLSTPVSHNLSSDSSSVDVEEHLSNVGAHCHTGTQDDDDSCSSSSVSGVSEERGEVDINNHHHLLHPHPLIYSVQSPFSPSTFTSTNSSCDTQPTAVHSISNQHHLLDHLTSLQQQQHLSLNNDLSGCEENILRSPNIADIISPSINAALNNRILNADLVKDNCLSRVNVLPAIDETSTSNSSSQLNSNREQDFLGSCQSNPTNVCLNTTSLHHLSFNPSDVDSSINFIKDLHLKGINNLEIGLKHVQTESHIDVNMLLENRSLKGDNEQFSGNFLIFSETAS